MSALTQWWAPRGRIASGSSNTEVTWTDSNLHVLTALGDIKATAVAGRRYEVSFTTFVSSDTAGEAVFIRLYDGGTSAPTAGTPGSLLFADAPTVAAVSRYEGRTYVLDWAPTAGLHRLAIIGSRSSGTTSTQTIGSSASGRITSLIVKDVGPS